MALAESEHVGQHTQGPILRGQLPFALRFGVSRCPKPTPLPHRPRRSMVGAVGPSPDSSPTQTFVRSSAHSRQHGLPRTALVVCMYIQVDAGQRLHHDESTRCSWGRSEAGAASGRRSMDSMPSPAWSVSRRANGACQMGRQRMVWVRQCGVAEASGRGRRRRGTCEDHGGRCGTFHGHHAGESIWLVNRGGTCRPVGSSR